MNGLRMCLAAAALQFVCLGAAHGQAAWVNASEISVEGHGRGDACVKDATARAMPEAWKSALADMRISASEPLLQCMVEQTAKRNLLEARVRKDDARRIEDGRCQVPFTVRYRKTDAWSLATQTCVQVADLAPVGIVFRAERRKSGEDRAQADESMAGDATSGLGAWIARTKLKAMELPEDQDAFVRLRTSLSGGCALTFSAGSSCETVLGSPAEARTLLTRMLSDELSSNRSSPDLQRWRDCGGLLAVGTLAISTDTDARQFSNVRGRLHITYFALSRDLTLIASDNDSRVQAVTESNGGEEQAVRDIISRMMDKVGHAAADKLSMFVNSQGCAAR